MSQDLWTAAQVDQAICLLQVICLLQWVMVQWDLLQVKVDLLQVIWQDQAICLLQDQAICLLQVMVQWDLLQELIWTETVCLLLLQVKVDQIHYLEKQDLLVDLLQVICLLQVILVEMGQVECLQEIWDRVDQVICLPLQMEWVTCIRIWTTQELIMLQKDLLREMLLDRCLVICPQICLLQQTIQMTVVR